MVDPPFDDYLTLAGEHRHEPEKVKGSRFPAAVAPAASPEAAEHFVARVAAEHAGARHVCWAWRLGPGGDRARASDAGEPGGSAGAPILAQLEHRGISDAVVVVARYFGGVKLGIGGLMRAYGGAAGQCLDGAEVVRVRATRRVAVEHPYDCSGAVRGLLSAEGLAPARAEYGALVRLELDVPLSALERFRRELADRTAGRARLT